MGFGRGGRAGEGSVSERSRKKQEKISKVRLLKANGMVESLKSVALIRPEFKLLVPKTRSVKEKSQMPAANCHGVAKR